MTDVKSTFYSNLYYKGLNPETRFSKCVEIFSKLTGKRLLDVGCGDGDISLMLKDSMNAKEVFGVDIAQKAVDEANKKGVKAFLVDIDNKNLPFENESMDIVYCGEVIEHVFDTDHLLLEIYRVLKPHGTCVLTTPNLSGWSNRFALSFGYHPYCMAVSARHESLGKLLIKGYEGQWGHIRVFTLRALREMVELYNFKVKTIVGCPVTVKSSLPHLTGRFVVSVDKAFSHFPSMSSRVIVVLEKE